MCDITSGRARPCKTSVGGLKKVWIFPFIKFNRSQIVRDELTLLEFPFTTIYEFQVLPNANVTQTQDDDDGTKSYKQSISIQLAQNQNIIGLEVLIKSDVRIIVEDHNGNFRLLGAYNGVECTSLDYTTGSSKNSLNGITFNFEATEREEALYIDEIPNDDFAIRQHLLLEDGTFLLLEDGQAMELE